MIDPRAPLVEVDAVSFRYRRATEPAIRDVSLAIEPGTVTLVAGPSGCGKSTLIRTLNGLVPHAYPGELHGEVRIRGRPTTELRLRDIARTVGTVLQDPARQIVGATVESELAFGPENLGLPPVEIRRRLSAVASRTAIEHLVGRETAALSGGERQLVAVAGILMMEPDVLVLDEPLANLDPATADRLVAILRRLADEGRAIVIVEHRVEEALALAPDRVLYLEEGRVAYAGAVEGFLRVADPGAVKLPFEVVLDRVRQAADPGAGSEPFAPVEPPRDTLDGPPRLEFRDVDVVLGERPVLRGLSARFGRREAIAVLGPNGSGKTTLFRTAMRLVPTRAGEVLVDGVSTARRTVAELATIFGFVFQSPSQMLFARTVREELLFGPRNLGRPASAAESLLARVLRQTALDSVEGILDRPPLTLSFGQQKRLALAIALALEPRTLVLDEPSAGQDYRTARRFMAEVSRIDELESTYFITHDVDLALTHADRILLLRDGQVVADGPPARVTEDEERWRSCNLHVTSLMRANARWRMGDGRFLDAETLAHRIVAQERSRGGGKNRASENHRRE
ncbi:MAG TPA: ABC transporter ATP-binding protein [Candidatus Binatia bacterium]|nr:ABC transporter ATP-binding protein [Candidatus Binatia bacterium]